MDRFSLSDWVAGNFTIKSGYEDHQMLDVTEEFLHLLVIILSDRAMLRPNEEQMDSHVVVARRDMVHFLCFKALTYSELGRALPDRITMMAEFEELLESITDYHAPDGLSDAGTMRLKDECYAEIDPYYAYYNKSQREEAETILRKRIAVQTGASVEDSFWQPSFAAIRTGVFVGLADFTQTALFAQVIRTLLHYVEKHETYTPNIPQTRVEALLQVVLHLLLVAAKEDTCASPAALPHQ